MSAQDHSMPAPPYGTQSKAEPVPGPAPVAPVPAGAEDAPEAPQSSALLVREVVETIILTLFIFWMVNTVTGRFRIEGHSMDPTLSEGQYVLINKLAYYLDEPQRGDIIVLEFPNDHTRDFIKRIIGLPGDHVVVDDQQVTVNGVILEEPYIKAPPNYSGTWDVPEGNYFVLGDNRNNSHDSHSWSFLPEQDIVGKAWLIYWGPSDWGLVPHYSHPIS